MSPPGLLPSGQLETTATPGSWPTTHPHPSSPPSPPPPAGWHKIPRGGPGSDTSCDGITNHAESTCIYDKEWCVSMFDGQCGMLETEAGAKCGAWDQCGGVVCRGDYDGYCLARARMSLKADPRMWGYSKHALNFDGNLNTWGAHRVSMTVRRASASVSTNASTGAAFAEVYVWLSSSVRCSVRMSRVQRENEGGKYHMEYIYICCIVSTVCNICD